MSYYSNIETVLDELLPALLPEYSVLTYKESFVDLKLALVVLLEVEQSYHNLVVGDLVLYQLTQQDFFRQLFTPAFVQQIRGFMALQEPEMIPGVGHEPFKTNLGKLMAQLFEGCKLYRIEANVGRFYILADRLPASLQPCVLVQEVIGAYITGSSYDAYLLCDDTGRQVMTIYGRRWDLSDRWDSSYYPEILRYYRPRKLRALLE